MGETPTPPGTTGFAGDALLRAGALLGPPASPAAALRAAEACATIPESAARCRLVTGRARYLLGDLPGAAAAFSAAVDAGLGSLEPHGLYLWGEALLLSGQAGQSLGPLRRAAAGAGPVAARAAALLADALYEQGDLAAAADQALTAAGAALLPASARADLAATRAHALCTLAERAPLKSNTHAAAVREALLALRLLWHDFPDHPAALEAAAREAALGNLGTPLPAPTGHERLGRAQRLLSAGMPALATKEAALARAALAPAKAKATPEDRAEAALVFARALAADGKRGDAAAALDEAWKGGSPKVAAAAGLLLARDRSRRGNTKDAIALLDLLQKKFPGASEADDGAFLAARLALDAGDGKDGERRLAKLTARRSGPAAEARWSLAWLSYRAGRPDASERFAAYAAAAEDDTLRARGLYWQARAGPPTKAITLFTHAASLDPLGWYGLLAQQALGGPGGAAPAFPPSHARVPGPPRPALELAQALLDLGLRAEAAAELELYVQSHRGDAEALLPALLAFERAGRTDRSVLIAQQLLQGHPPPVELRDPARARQGAQDKTGRALLELAYPAPYPREVQAAAQRSGLDPYLLLAVARRESVFRPDARSAAGAVGLLQLLPLTARRAAAVLGRPAPDEELGEPGAAIDLGAWYFSELVGRYGDPAIAAAAYNAGPKAASVWVKKAQGQPLDLFVEEIPFRETRLYVKLVLGAWSAYRILAGGGPPRLGAAVPAPVSGVEF